MHAGESALCKISATRNRKFEHSSRSARRSPLINFAVVPLHYALRPFFIMRSRHMILCVCAVQVRANKNTAAVMRARV